MDASQLRTIEQQVGEGLDEKKLAGAVTMVIRNGGVVHLEAHGWLDVENRVPMRTDTIFRIYSMTKPVTSVATLMLVEQGLMRLDDPVEKHLPELKALRVYKTKRKQTKPTGKSNK